MEKSKLPAQAQQLPQRDRQNDLKGTVTGKDRIQNSEHGYSLVLRRR